MTLLKDAQAKVARAKEQLAGLEAEFQRFSDSKPYTLRQEHDLETQEFILVYYPSSPIPDNWPIIIGEILYNLRSALDLAVYELTVREQGAPLKNTEFPIFDDKDLFSALKKNGDPAPGSGLFKIRGLSQKTRDCIESMQPYNLRQPDRVSTLLLLHEMNILDKHRELHLCRVRSLSTKTWLVRDAPGFISWGFGNVNANLDERTVINTLKLASGLDDEVYMDGDIAILIAFDQRCSPVFKRQENVVAMIRNMIKADEIVLNLLTESVT